MMDDNLKKRIDVLFRNVPGKDIVRNYFCDGDMYVGKTYSTTELDNPIQQEPETWELDNEFVILLVKLYTQLSKNIQTEYIGLLEDKAYGRFNYDVKFVATLALLHVGQQMSVVNSLTTKFNSYSNDEYLPVLYALEHFITYQSHLMTTETIEQLADWSDAYFDGKTKVGLNRNEYKILYQAFDPVFRSIYNKSNEIILNEFKLQIEAGYNPDISIDEVKVKDAIEALGLSLDLTVALEHISELVSKADTAAKYRDAMSAIRAFNERLLERIAKDLNQDTKIDGKDTEKAVKEFKTKHLISHDVGELIVSFRHFLSNDGTHRLNSKQEDARIAKSLNIEISLYLLRRLEEARV